MKIALRAEANGQWVCADDNFDGKAMPSRPLQANRPGDVPPTGWEKFNMAMELADGTWVPFEFPAPPPPPEPIPPTVPVPPANTGLPEINSQNFVVWGSDPACLDFPATGRLTSWGLVPGTMSMATTHCDHWPAVAIDETGNPAQNATLWVLEQIDGIWYATGAERLRPEQLNGDKPSGQPPTVIGHDWLYDPARWGPMAYRDPAPGEVMGVMLVAGSTRSDNQTPLKARTNPLWIHWPNAQGANPAQLVAEGEAQALAQVGRDFAALAAISPLAVLGGVHWILSRYERLRGCGC